jgi:hypothetical protein
MRKLLIIIVLFAIYAYGQCLGGPISTRFGIKTGLVYSTFDPDDNTGGLSGMGFQIGLGMGTDIMNALSIDMTPQLRTTSFGRTDEILGTEIKTTISYTNLYLPVQFSLKAGMLPVLAPYIGIGLAGNFQMSGTVRVETEGSAIESDIDKEDLENDFFLVGAVGTDIKLVNFKIVPEISINYNLTADLHNENNPNQTYDGENIDLHFAVGFYFSP